MFIVGYYPVSGSEGDVTTVVQRGQVVSELANRVDAVNLLVIGEMR